MRRCRRGGGQAGPCPEFSEHDAVASGCATRIVKNELCRRAPSFNFFNFPQSPSSRSALRFADADTELASDDFPKTSNVTKCVTSRGVAVELLQPCIKHNAELLEGHLQLMFIIIQKMRLTCVTTETLGALSLLLAKSPPRRRRQFRAVPARPSQNLTPPHRRTSSASTRRDRPCSGGRPTERASPLPERFPPRT